MAAKGWRLPFDDAIPLPGGKQMVTLENAARYVQHLPASEQRDRTGSSPSKP